MAIRLDQFAKRLVDSGLISADEVAAIVSALPAERQSDAEALARDLVRSRRLTAFQVQEIYQGRGKGLVLGNYVVLDKLGQGGMGMVLKAEHRRMERLVALKILSPSVTKSPDIVARFQREVKAAAKLNHPNIVTAYDADEAGGTHFLVMEYVEGTDLSALVKKNGPLPLDRALHCITQAARGLEYAHTRGVVHRDIKPGNLLLDRDGTVKILDMGLARLDSAGPDQDELTGTGQIMGTVDYMAPEQALSTKSADRRADIYSLGITLWYLLTGRPVYAGDSALAKLLAHRERTIPSLREVCPAVSPALDAVFARMVAKTPEARYQTMAGALADLERGGTGREEPPSQTAAPGEDSRLSEFLRGLEQSEGGHGRAKAAIAQVTSPRVIEETISSSGQPGDTDPTTEQSLGQHRTRLLGRAKGGSGIRRLLFPTTRRGKLLVYGGAAMLLLAGVAGLWRANQGTVRVAEGDSLVTVVTTPTADDPVSIGQAIGGRQPPGNSEPGTPTNLAGDKSSDWKGWPADAPAPAIAPFDIAQARQHQQAWANHLGVPVEYTNSIGMRFRLIPPGEFMMGSTAEEVEEALKGFESGWRELIMSTAPRHRVILTHAHYMGTCEVTQSQFNFVMGSNPSSFSESGARKEAVAASETAQFPVETVSWHDAVAFCKSLSELEDSASRDKIALTQVSTVGEYRLPTEAEWEFACRAGSTTKYWYGDAIEGLSNVAWIAPNSLGQTHATGNLQSNPFGLFDVHGNVWEWVHDRWEGAYYTRFAELPAVNPTGSPAGEKRVFRGGDWGDAGANCASSMRLSYPPERKDEFIGFRVALSVDAVKQAQQDLLARAARYEHALEFDGLDDLVELPTLTFDNTRPFTLELWADVRNPEQDPLLAQLGGVPSRRAKLQVITATGRNSLRGEVYSDLDGAVGDTVPYQQMVSTRSFSAGLVHAALCWDPAGNVTLYENGRLASTTNSKWNLARPPGHPSAIGSVSAQARKSWLQGRVWRARLSNVIRYREEFTPTADWEPDAETVALYRFDDGEGDVLTDASGNGNHGKIIGATWVSGNDTPAPATSIDVLSLADVDRDGIRHEGRIGGRWQWQDGAPKVLKSTGEMSLIEFPLELSGDYRLRLRAQKLGVKANEGLVLGLVVDGVPVSIIVGYEHDGIVVHGFEPPHVAKGERLPTGREFEVEIVVRGRTVRAAVDGQTVMDITGNPNDMVGPGNEFWKRRIPTRLCLGCGGDHWRIIDFDYEPLTELNVAGAPSDPPANVVAANTALQFDGQSGHVHVPTLSRDDAGPITLETWVRPEVQEGHKAIALLSGQHPLQINTYNDRLYAFDSRTSFRDIDEDTLPKFVPGQWHHVAAVCDDANIRFFVDGRGQGQFPLQPADVQTPRAFSGLWLGGHPHEQRPKRIEYRYRGQIDEVRVSRGARYQDDFQPPRRMEADADTLALYHCDDAAGDVLADASGHGHKGRIVDPRWTVAWDSNVPDPAIAPFDAARAKQHQEEWADHLGVPVEYTNSIGMKFRLIPPGEFLMGSTAKEVDAALLVWPGLDEREKITSESPRHRVILTKPIYVGAYEVTQSQYAKVLDSNPSYFSSTGNGKVAVTGLDTANHPVEQVNWNDAAEFCSKLSQIEKLEPSYFRTGESVTLLNGTGYRLPTEAEWEFVCRAGSTTKYWTGDNEEELLRVGWFGSNSGNRTHAVGQLMANPFGIHDIHGNAFEWVQDWQEPAYYGLFQSQPAIDPTGPASPGHHRVFRGWAPNAGYCRSAMRYWFPPTTRHNLIGMRVVLPVDAVAKPAKAAAQVDPQRAVIEWVLSKGGTVAGLAAKAVGEAEFKHLAAGDSIPSEFDLLEVDLRRSDISVTDLDRLLPAVNLRLLTLIGCPLDAAALPRLAQLPYLTSLNLVDTRIKSSNFATLANLPCLVHLRIATAQIDDGCEAIGRLPHLRTLTLWRQADLTAADVRGLVGMSGLRQLSLDGFTAFDSQIAQDLQRDNPLLRVVIRGGDGPARSLGTDPALAAAKKLLGDGVTIWGSPIGSGNPVAPLSGADLDASHSWLFDRADFPKGHAFSAERSSELAALTGDLVVVNAENVTNADGLAAALADNAGAVTLAIVKSDLSDAGLKRLKTLTGLRYLNIRDCPVTPAAIEHFHRRVPNCRLVFSGGEHLPLWLPPPNFSLVAGEFDRPVAEWVHSVGGLVGVVSTGRPYQELPAGQPLPDGPFVLTKADLLGRPLMDDDLRRFDRLPHLSVLILTKTKVTDSGLESLGKLPNLKSIYLGDLSLTPPGLRALSRYPTLTKLHVDHADRALLEVIVEMTSLQELRASRGPIGDQEVPLLAKLANLALADLRGTQVTQAGVDALRKLLPNCRVKTSFGEFGPSAE